MAEPASARTDLPGEGSGRSARDNPGDWIPFLDWREVFPGNRGVDRRGVYNLFDAPVGIALQVEPSEPSEPLLIVEKSWEDPANMQPSATWRDEEDGSYGIIYAGRDGAICLARSPDGYQFHRPALGQVEWSGSIANNILADGPACGILLDPKAPPEERYKGLGQEGGYYDPLTGEKLASREGEARQKAMEEGGPGYSGPQAEMRHWVVAWVSPDRLHWKRVERPAAPFPVRRRQPAPVRRGHGYLLRLRARARARPRGAGGDRHRGAGALDRPPLDRADAHQGLLRLVAAQAGDLPDARRTTRTSPSTAPTTRATRGARTCTYCSCRSTTRTPT